MHRFSGLLGAVSLLICSTAAASSPVLVHQTQQSIIVRMQADGENLVWQEVGDKKSEKFLYRLELASGAKSEIKTTKRPFGPSVAGGAVIFGQGHLNEKIDVLVYDFAAKRSFRLHKLVPWIVEPAMQLRTNEDGSKRLQAVWERSTDIDGNGLAIYLWEGTSNSRGGSLKILVDGPVLRKSEIPRQYHHMVHNEYPEIDGDVLAFQNDEFGTPNIYRMNFVTGAVSRLHASGFYQERPAIQGPFTAWEQSERGYASSNVSSLFIHDSRDGKVRKLNSEQGFHYQVRILAPFVIYGTKRQPMPSTPSIRVYDLEQGAEIQANECFPGSIYDWTPTAKGLYVAQRAGPSSSRLLFATWDQIRARCN